MLACIHDKFDNAWLAFMNSAASPFCEHVRSLMTVLAAPYTGTRRGQTAEASPEKLSVWLSRHIHDSATCSISNVILPVFHHREVFDTPTPAFGSDLLLLCQGRS